MAKGDVIVDILSVPTATSVEFQPATGVEVVISEVGTQSQAADISVGLFDTTLYTYYGTNVARWSGKLFITNGHWLRILNNNASTMSISYSGVQVK